MKAMFVTIAWIALAGCAASMTRSVPAERVNATPVTPPCSAGRGAPDCGNALFNTTVISQIHKGQSRTEVRAIMKHDAERREVERVTESWGYMTNYETRMITWITFTDQKVSSLTHEVIERD